MFTWAGLRPSKLAREFERLREQERIYATELPAIAVKRNGLFSRILDTLKHALQSLFGFAKKEEKVIAREVVSDEKAVIERLKEYEKILAAKLSDSAKRLEHYEKTIALLSFLSKNRRYIFSHRFLSECSSMRLRILPSP
jgi:hypothetical protein